MLRSNRFLLFSAAHFIGFRRKEIDELWKLVLHVVRLEKERPNSMLMKIFLLLLNVRLCERDIHTRSVNHLDRTSYAVTSLMGNELNMVGVYWLSCRQHMKWYKLANFTYAILLKKTCLIFYYLLYFTRWPASLKAPRQIKQITLYVTTVSTAQCIFNAETSLSSELQPESSVLQNDIS